MSEEPQAELEKQRHAGSIPRSISVLVVCGVFLPPMRRSPPRKRGDLPASGRSRTDLASADGGNDRRPTCGTREPSCRVWRRSLTSARSGTSEYKSGSGASVEQCGFRRIVWRGVALCPRPRTSYISVRDRLGRHVEGNKCHLEEVS